MSFQHIISLSHEHGQLVDGKSESCIDIYSPLGLNLHEESKYFNL